MQVEFSREFLKRYKKATPKIKAAFDLRLELFVKNSSDLVLNNHSLKGKLLGFRSINISGDWRAIFTEELVNEETVVTFHLMGTHSQLYG